MKNNLKFSALFISSFLFLTSCSNDDYPAPVNEEEVITTVQITLLSSNSSSIVMKSTDLDGDGPNPPEYILTGGNLVAGESYTGSVEFLNELENPVGNITEEVEAEGQDHQVFYQLPASIGNITYDALNVDANGKPIGLEFSLVAGTSGSTGNLTVTLRHLPNKSANGVSNGDITNAGGSTDAEVSFPVVVD